MGNPGTDVIFERILEGLGIKNARIYVCLFGIFIAIWYFPVLVCCIKKNLATLITVFSHP
jgi:hypothetical protein